jgi:uncharacterized GH25 family protein
MTLAPGAGFERKRFFMIVRAAFLPLVLIATPALGHDFWIQPERFQTSPGAPLGATFLVGHGDARDRWGNNHRIVLLADFFNGARRDQRALLRSSGPTDLTVRFVEPGLHVLGLQTNYAFSELPAIRFNDYAKEEGLVTALATRQRTGRMKTAGRERYSRRAKALIQVGRQTPANQALATRPIGLKLEIVTERNPYALGANRELPVHVLYNGRRLPNATVKLTSLEKDDRPVSIKVTDKAGRARFSIPPRGSWLLNVVWTEPVTGDRRVDFDTTFSSLTFGYGNGSRK